MNKLREFLGRARVAKALDILQLIVAVISLILMVLKMKGILPNLDANLVVLIMMSVVIIVNALKSLSRHSSNMGLQIIIFVIFILLFGFLAGFIKNMLFGS